MMQPVLCLSSERVAQYVAREVAVACGSHYHVLVIARAAQSSGAELHLVVFVLRRDHLGAQLLSSDNPRGHSLHPTKFPITHRPLEAFDAGCTT
eukprot:m51a1_g13530 hypothetical protein (94) ;mRNA; f:3048-3444